MTYSTKKKLTASNWIPGRGTKDSAEVGSSTTEQAGSISYIAELLRTSPEPVDVSYLVSSLEERNLSHNLAQTLVEQALDEIYQAIPVGLGRYGWFSTLLQGNVIRHPLTTEEANQGFLLLDELEHAAFFPEFFQSHQPNDRILHIELFGGPTIAAEAYIERKTWSLSMGSQFVKWIDMQGGEGQDDILIIVKDATAGEYLLRLQPREARDDSSIQNRNVQISLIAEEIVRNECGKHGAIPTWDLAAHLVGHGAFNDCVPPDDLHCVLHQYSLLRFNSGSGYSLEANMGQQNSSLPNTGPNISKVVPQPDSEFTPPHTDQLCEENWSRWPEEALIGSGPYDQEDDDATTELNAYDGSCLLSDQDYEAYLDKVFQAGLMDSPLSQDEFIILKAELEALVNIEQEFGYLLTEQRHRCHELTSCLFMDSNSIQDDDADLSGFADFGDAPQ